MSWGLAHIYRHPVKSLGEEALDAVDLVAGKPMAWDRTWAIAHAGADWSETAPAWIGGGAKVLNQTYVPEMVRTTTRYDAATATLYVNHPLLGAAAMQPGTPEGKAALIQWIKPLAEQTAYSGPYKVCEGPDLAFTDFEDTHIAIATTNSLRALQEMAGQSLQHVRFRMNLWLEGPPPWSELDWVDREIEIGSARLKITARDKRCNATNANPDTGTRDTQIPALLRQRLGHMDFGVYAQVVQSGTVRCGDTATLV